MSKSLNQIIAAVLAAVLLCGGLAVQVRADGEAGTGKYVSDVFIAYGKTEDDAVQWLLDNGWEPISGDNDFNAGKASFWDNSKWHEDNVAAAMGIKRTSSAEEAITDMAVMNMSGGYSIPDYETLLKEKKGEIDEFIGAFMPAIQEFRDNYNGKGSAYGKRRAELVNTILNKFVDGKPGDPNAANDTCLQMGDLFRNKLQQEGNPGGGDLQQILLESSGAAVTLIEQMMALGADTGKESWIERLRGLSGDQLQENLPQYVPEAAGQNVSPSAAINFLKQRFGDAAKTIAKGWTDVHEELKWYETYNAANDLWQQEGEEETAYVQRIDAFFETLKAADEEEYERVRDQYIFDGTLYDSLYETEYEGEWGASLGDFFNPADGTDYSLDEDLFLTFAAAMSEGQRALLEYVSLSSFLLAGIGNETGLDAVSPDLNKTFGSDFELDIYSGINRSIFRGGVAITSEALMEQNMGKGNAFDKMWDHVGLASIVSYVSAVVGVGMIIAGGVMIAKGARINYVNVEGKAEFWDAMTRVQEAEDFIGPQTREASAEIAKARETLKKFEIRETTKLGYAGRAVLAIGGALLLGAAFLKGYQMIQYYHRKFTPIPLMIVDESDIVTYLEDENGNPLLDETGKQMKNIDFKDYEYYEAVRCNRQEAGAIGDPQDGVDSYTEWGCGDVADLNADMGQEWLALYTVKSPNKGKPILADSLVLQYGSDSHPKGTTKCLHFFEYTYAMDLGDTAYAYNNKKDGVFFFWDEDANSGSSWAASVFSAGHLAAAGVGGVILGAVIATILQICKRKRKTEEESQDEQ